jgi:hypothetical protein
MAKQVGPFYFTGTLDDVIFYKSGDQYCIRSKGWSKTGKQMARDPQYSNTMRNARWFGRGSTLVRPVYYRHLPKALRKQGAYGKLTGMANHWVRQGKSDEEITRLLIAHCQQLAAQLATPAPATKEANPPVPPPATAQRIIEWATALPATVGRGIASLPTQDQSKKHVHGILGSGAHSHLSTLQLDAYGRLQLPEGQQRLVHKALYASKGLIGQTADG